MALSKNTLRDLIMTKVEAKFGTLPSRARPVMLDLFEAIADAVVSHVTADGEVRITDTDSGLQKDPDTGTPTVAPDSTKTLNIF